MSNDTEVSLTGWLLLRIAEDEESADEVNPDWEFGVTADLDLDAWEWQTRRNWKECAAKRAIVALHPWDYPDTMCCRTCFDGYEMSGDHVPVRWPCATLRAVASVYADRPGFRPEWRP